MRIIAKVLPQSPTITVPTSMGPVEIRPGTVWSHNRMVVNAGWMEVYYAIDDRLYVMSSGLFLQSEWLNALSAGASRAAWLIPIAKAEMALLAGLFAPWYLMLGMTCAKTAVVYYTHKSEVELVYKHAERMLGALMVLREKHKTLFDKVIRRAAWETLKSLPSGVTGEDVGFLIGRLLRGLDAAPELTMAAIAKMAFKTTAIVATIHLPNIALHGVEQLARAHAAELRREFAKAGYSMSDDEAAAILRDIIKDNKFNDTMNNMQDAAKELGPALKALEEALKD